MFLVSIVLKLVYSPNPVLLGLTASTYKPLPWVHVNHALLERPVLYQVYLVRTLTATLVIIVLQERATQMTTLAPLGPTAMQLILFLKVGV